ncbi:hypothetical protein [Paenibacillus sp. ACRRY]|uniref:hypothetical protein n=1 Tax=Paenibacillus sp. ACRRY TaxID=2918208 RepID=UPI001EF4A61B|nr:hypothetical protein [Paenibacillus sp. ACRRY]MCG7385013.1 hypothetical protein [Paenibacillus sp. ACRRY]
MRSKPKLIFYISDYGYGHATRSIALIRELMLPKYGIGHLTICSGKALTFIQDSLPCDHRIDYRELSLDLGYVHEAGSMDLSLDLFQERYEYLQCSFSDMVSGERDFLVSKQFDMVLSDISPAPLLAASQLKIVSVGISNFTWYTAYEEALNSELIHFLESCYRCMDYFVRLPGGNSEPAWGRCGEISVDFYCRSVDPIEEKRIRAQLDPFHNKTIVFFGLGMGIELTDLPNMKLLKNENFIFIVSSNMGISGPNIFNIDRDYTETQNFVAASDIVLSKPGWSTVSEAIVSHKPLILLEREKMPEDRKTIDAARLVTNTVTISWNELRDMEDPKFYYRMLKSRQRNFLPLDMKKSGVEVISEFVTNLLSFHITT